MIIINNVEFFETKYAGYYVSKTGEIYSEKVDRVLRGKHDKDGYIEYCLCIKKTALC